MLKEEEECGHGIDPTIIIRKIRRCGSSFVHRIRPLFFSWTGST